MPKVASRRGDEQAETSATKLNSTDLHEHGGQRFEGNNRTLARWWQCLPRS